MSITLLSTLALQISTEESYKRPNRRLANPHWQVVIAGMSTETPPKRVKVDQAEVEQGLNGQEAPIDLENEEPAADTEEDALLEQELRSAQADLDKVRPQGVLHLAHHTSLQHRNCGVQRQDCKPALMAFMLQHSNHLLCPIPVHLTEGIIHLLVNHVRTTMSYLCTGRSVSIQGAS